MKHRKNDWEKKEGMEGSLNSGHALCTSALPPLTLSPPQEDLSELSQRSLGG